MKFLAIVLSLLFSHTLIAAPGSGHEHGHSHGNGPVHSHGPSAETKISEKKAAEVGRAKIRVLVFQGKIDKSWNEAKLDKAIIKKFDGKKEWLITYTNSKGVKGKKLYVFLEPNGKFVAANFTGK